MQNVFQSTNARKTVIRLIVLILLGVIPMLTFEILKKIAPNGRNDILKSVVEYQELFEKYDITDKRRLTYFLAQLAHESDGFRTTREYASGKAYEGRKDLGNTRPGDGVRYRGRGLIQLTGRYNYKLFGEKIGVDLENNPDLAEQFPIALEVALVYWDHHDLNRYCDKGDFKGLTKRINGGLNGYADRVQWLAKMEARLD